MFVDPLKGRPTHIPGLPSPSLSLRPRDLCQKIIRARLIRAADDMESDMPPENCSRLIRWSVAAKIYPVRQGGICAAGRSAGYCDRFDRGVTAWSVLEVLDGDVR